MTVFHAVVGLVHLTIIMSLDAVETSGFKGADGGDIATTSMELEYGP